MRIYNQMISDCIGGEIKVDKKKGGQMSAFFCTQLFMKGEELLQGSR